MKIFYKNAYNFAYITDGDIFTSTDIDYSVLKYFYFQDNKINGKHWIIEKEE